MMIMLTLAILLLYAGLKSSYSLVSVEWDMEHGLHIIIVRKNPSIIRKMLGKKEEVKEYIGKCQVWAKLTAFDRDRAMKGLFEGI